jgi:parallel beta-helix repeat protein
VKVKVTRAISLGVALALATAGTGSWAKNIIVEAGASVQDAVNTAEPGDTILVQPGVYKQSVYIDKPNITLQGLRDGDNWATFDGEGILNDGIIASGHFIVIDGFRVRGYKGNGIMTQGANNFQINNNFVEGAFYGIFPQYGRNGLVQGNTVTGAEDAGIYVGMSDSVDVLDNVAYGNVMGLEFENCRDALMANNEVYNNSAGIALTVIPGLPVKDAYNLIIRDNIIRDNNHTNFAPASSIAASVPEGVGLFVVGPDRVTVENNVFENNKSVGVLVLDMLSFGLSTDPEVDPFSDDIRVMSNTWINNGNEPMGLMGMMLMGQSGFEVMASGKERNACLLDQEGVNAAGTQSWGACDADMSVADFATAQLSSPAPAPVYTAEQKGRFTYLAVCTGCHAYDSVLHGPSMQSIQAMYSGKPEALASYAAEPVRKREDFPEMPPQGYLGDETLRAISSYILDDL